MNFMRYRRKKTNKVFHAVLCLWVVLLSFHSASALAPSSAFKHRRGLPLYSTGHLAPGELQFFRALETLGKQGDSWQGALEKSKDSFPAFTALLQDNGWDRLTIGRKLSRIFSLTNYERFLLDSIEDDARWAKVIAKIVASYDAPPDIAEITEPFYFLQGFITEDEITRLTESLRIAVEKTPRDMEYYVHYPWPDIPYLHKPTPQRMPPRIINEGMRTAVDPLTHEEARMLTQDKSLEKYRLAWVAFLESDLLKIFTLKDFTEHIALLQLLGCSSDHVRTTLLKKLEHDVRSDTRDKDLIGWSGPGGMFGSPIAEAYKTRPWRATALCLLQLGVSREQIVGLLLQALSSTDPYNRILVVEALQALNVPHTEYVPLLRRLLHTNTSESPARFEIIKLLVQAQDSFEELKFAIAECLRAPLTISRLPALYGILTLGEEKAGLPKSSISKLLGENFNPFTFEKLLQDVWRANSAKEFMEVFVLAFLRPIESPKDLWARQEMFRVLLQKGAGIAWYAKPEQIAEIAQHLQIPLVEVGETLLTQPPTGYCSLSLEDEQPDWTRDRHPEEIFANYLLELNIPWNESLPLQDRLRSLLKSKNPFEVVLAARILTTITKDRAEIRDAVLRHFSDYSQQRDFQGWGYWHESLTSMGIDARVIQGLILEKLRSPALQTNVFIYNLSSLVQLARAHALNEKASKQRPPKDHAAEFAGVDAEAKLLNDVIQPTITVRMIKETSTTHPGLFEEQLGISQKLMVEKDRSVIDRYRRVSLVLGSMSLMYEVAKEDTQGGLVWQPAGIVSFAGEVIREFLVVGKRFLVVNMANHLFIYDLEQARWFNKSVASIAPLPGSTITALAEVNESRFCVFAKITRMKPPDSWLEAIVEIAVEPPPGAYTDAVLKAGSIVGEML